MALSLTEFRHLCLLARLEPDAAAQEQLAAQCSDIFAYMDKLSELDTADVDPLYSPVAENGITSPAREDEAFRRQERAVVLANAPETDGAFFIVPRIVEGK